MAQIVSTVTKQDFLPSNLMTTFKADNIPQGIVTYNGLRIVNAVIDTLLSKILPQGKTIHEWTTLSVPIPNVGTIELGDAWDILDYFIMNGFKINVDLANLIAIALSKGAKNLFSIKVSVADKMFSHLRGGGTGLSPDTTPIRRSSSY